MSDDRLNLFGQLAQAALSHTRMLFIGQNPHVKQPLPMKWLHDVKPTIKEQLTAYLN